MKIVLSNSTRGAYQGVLADVKKRLAEGGECIIITTDRLTATVERELLSALTREGEEGSAAFNIEVTSFTRLGVKLLGESVKKCLTPEGSVMLLANVIAKKREELLYYRNSRSEGFANEMYAAVTALRNSGVSSGELRAHSSALPPALARKTADVALIYEGYLTALEGRHSDSSTRLEALGEYLSSPAAQQEIGTKNFYIIDIVDFNAPQLTIISGLDKYSLSLTVGCVDGFNSPNKRLYPTKTLSALHTAARGRAEEVVYFDNLNPVANTIGKYLFSYQRPAKPVECGDKLKLRAALNRRDEILRLAVDVMIKVRSGARFRDFEVLIGDLDAYTPLIKSVFSRYDIPFFIDNKEPLYEQTKVRYLLSALSAFRCRFRRDEILDFVKNPLLMHSLEGEDDRQKEDKVFQFENYVLEYGINYSGFERPFEKGNESRLAYAEEVRSVAMDKLSNLPLIKNAPFAEFVSAARKILDGCEDAWRRHVEKLTELSAYYKKCAEQVDDKLVAVLDEIEDVLGGNTNIGGFESILRSMLKTIKISLVPTYLDCVFIGDLSSRFVGLGEVYVVGANAGCLPPDHSGGAVLTPSDEELFESVGIELYTDERQKIRQDLFVLIEVLKKARGTLVISYAESSPGGLQRPSSIIAQLVSMFGKKGEPLVVERISFDRYYAMPKAERDQLLGTLFSTERGCLNEVMSGAVSRRGAAEDGEYYNAAFSFVNSDDAERINRLYSRPEKLSAVTPLVKTGISRIERYFTCPYDYYLNYILALKPREEGELTTLENGIIIHAVLERFFTLLRDGLLNEENLESAVIDVFADFIESNPKLKRVFGNSKGARILSRLQGECVKTCRDLYEISLRSNFKPTYLEAEFSDKSMFDFMPLSNGVNLVGKIDRVDVYDDRFIVVDYKTYRNINFGASDLYYGSKLQLYIYAAAIQRALNKKPAGVFYMPVFPTYVKEGTVRYKYRGQTSDSQQVRADIDSLSASNAKQSVVPDAATAVSKAATYLSDDGFALRSEYALALAAEGAREINEGVIVPRPLDDACKRCMFCDVCPYNAKYPRFAQSVNVESFCLGGVK